MREGKEVCEFGLEFRAAFAWSWKLQTPHFNCGKTDRTEEQGGDEVVGIAKLKVGMENYKPLDWKEEGFQAWSSSQISAIP